MSQLLRATLSFHRPEDIYIYLENKLGPLAMVIKKGQAIISFKSPEHAAIALSKHSRGMVNGFPLNLSVYDQSAPQIAAAQPNINTVEASKPKDELIQMIEENLEMREGMNKIERAVKLCRRGMAEQAIRCQSMTKIALEKYEELTKKCETEEGKQQVQEKMLQHFDTKFRSVNANLKNQLKQMNGYIKRYNAGEAIDIDDSPDMPTKNKFIPIIDFVNPDPDPEIKKIASLSENVVVTAGTISDATTKERHARIRYHNRGSSESKSLTFREGAYGLMVTSEYLLVGNYNGSITFVQHGHTELENSEVMHNGMIFQIVKCASRGVGLGVLTLGRDNFIKSWEGITERVTEDVNTLFFVQRNSFSLGGKDILAMDANSEGKIAVVGSYNNLVSFDIQTSRQLSTNQTRTHIFKVRHMTDLMIAVTHSNQLSFVDPRVSVCVTSCKLRDQLRALQPIGELYAFYGSVEGEVGLVDSRFLKTPVWSNNSSHRMRIYDICRSGSNSVVTVDAKGTMFSWNMQGERLAGDTM